MQDATRINGFLAIIVRLTGYELLLGLCVVFLRIALATRRFRKGAISPANRHRFELELQDLLRELGRRIMPWAVNSHFFGNLLITILLFPPKGLACQGLMEFEFRTCCPSRSED